jgi:hypothetical protein
VSRSTGLTTADEIRQVALVQFANGGYEGTSMRQIADGVGIRAASLYNHFGSKEEMLWDLTSSAIESLMLVCREALDELPDTPTASERLDAFVRAHVKFHIENSDQAQLVNGQMSSLSRQHRRQAVAQRDKYQDELAAILADGVASGEFDLPDERLVLFAILQMGTAVATWYRPSGRLGVDEVCDVYAELAQTIATGRRP